MLARDHAQELTCLAVLSDVVPRSPNTKFATRFASDSASNKCICRCTYFQLYRCNTGGGCSSKETTWCETPEDEDTSISGPYSNITNTMPAIQLDKICDGICEKTPTIQRKRTRGPFGSATTYDDEIGIQNTRGLPESLGQLPKR